MIPVSSSNSRFLGVLYTAALLAAFLQSWFGKRAPARTVTTMILVFTLVVTVCSLMHCDHFDPDRVEVWVWFAHYIGIWAKPSSTIFEPSRSNDHSRVLQGLLSRRLL